ncbi:MAG: hypothetical protein ACRENE_16495 [Polyangiaceae bacterium]
MTASNVVGLFSQVLEEATGVRDPNSRQILSFARAEGLHIRPDLIAAMEDLFENDRNGCVPFQGGEWDALIGVVNEFADRHFDA